LERLCQSTLAFAEDVTHRTGKSIWCDQTPWNLIIAARIANIYPSAVFVLMLRHYSGTILSLRRSYESGYRWAGATPEESAKLWARFYENVPKLPAERLIPVSYDLLCAKPEFVLGQLREALREHLQIDTGSLSLDVFLKSQASTTTRNTLAIADPNGAVQLRSISSVDRRQWTEEIEKICSPHVAVIDQALRLRFKGVYVAPV
jgi:hypothetical protein